MRTDYQPDWNDLVTELDDLRSHLVLLVSEWLPILEDKRGNHDHLSGMVAAYRLVIHTLNARVATIRDALDRGDLVPRFGCEDGPQQMTLFEDLDLRTWIAARAGQDQEGVNVGARRLLSTLDRDRYRR